MEGGNMAKEVQISDMNLLRQNSELIGKEKSKISTYKDQLNNALAKATNYEEINISEKARAIAESINTIVHNLEVLSKNIENYISTIDSFNHNDFSKSSLSNVESVSTNNSSATSTNFDSNSQVHNVQRTIVTYVTRTAPVIASVPVRNNSDGDDATPSETNSSNLKSTTDNSAADEKTSTKNSGVVTGKVNQDKIYSYLSKQGFNDAAICGILANMQHESNFRPNALGDGKTSYGICQWHAGRYTRLKNYCKQNNLDYKTVEGQLEYLVWELKNYYKPVYNTLKSVPNTSQGAYQAAAEWTKKFEVPANKEAAAVRRGNLAVKSYWSVYGKAKS